MLDTLTAAKLSFVFALASCAVFEAAAMEPPQPKAEASAKEGTPIADQAAPKSFERSSAPKVDPATVVPPEMCFVPAGTPKIGLDKEQLIAFNLENASFLTQLVSGYPAFNNKAIDAFYMDKFEVTNAQWKVYLDATGQKPSDSLVTNYWADGKIPKGQEKRPICYVTYPEVEKFAQWALKRLPTEFEWEYAARGTDGRFYPWGMNFDEGKDRGASRANCGESKGARAAADVGSFPEGASPFGIQDLCGNVWEWTSSPFTAYDSKTISIDIPVKGAKQPKVVSAASILTEKKNVIRGGAYDSNRIGLLATVRQETEPLTSYNTIGFRCVRDSRPGGDVVRRAIADLGSRRFENSPIAYAEVQASEQIHYDAQGLITGASYFVVAPSDAVLREKKTMTDVSAPLSIVDMMTRAGKGPVAIGLLASTEPVLEPKLSKGNYTIAILGKDLKVAEGQKKIVFPKSGWNYTGRTEEKDPKAVKPSKPAPPVAPVAPAKPKADHPSKDAKDGKDKKASDKGDKKGDKADKGEKPADEPAPAPEPPTEPVVPATPAVELPSGVVPVDRAHDALVLLDDRGEVVAAMALDGPPKEVPAAKGLAVDPPASGAATDSPSVTYRFRLGAAKNRTYEVVVPLRYRPLFTPATDAAAGAKK